MTAYDYRVGVQGSVQMIGQIFISYRREDSQHAAGRIYDRLVEEFGPERVFMDKTIPLGSIFTKVIHQKIADCCALIAVMGANWTDARDLAGNRRLENEKDFVRIEISAAMQQGIPVIPLLLDGATMPDVSRLPENLQELTERQALQVRHSS